MSGRRLGPLFALCLGLSWACADTPSSAPDSADVAEVAPDVTAPTWHGEVHAILARHCQSCHRADGVAPFALTSYDDAKLFGPLIVGATHARTMPPFLVDNSGDCNTFTDARWLTDSELETLAAWVDAGSPEGDDTLPPPAPVEPATLDGTVLTVSTGVDYIPRAGERDDYRCFVVPAPSELEQFVTGFDVTPGDPRIVHHVIVYAPRSAEAIAEVARLDEAEEGPGYTCYGTAGVQATVLAAWAPGGGATSYPEGTGASLAAGAPLVVQIHYNAAGAPGAADQTRVSLEVVPDGVTRGRYVPVADLGLTLPPDQKEATAGATLPVSLYPSIDGPVLVRGVFPHMHVLGRSLRVEIVRADGATICVADVKRWDFHWQMLYFLEDPIRLEPGDSLRIHCSFDTTGREQTTLWGESTSDEMCLAGLYVTPIDP